MTIRRFWTHSTSEIQISNPDPDPDGGKGRGNNNGKGRGASWTGRGRPPWAGGDGSGGGDPVNGFRSAFVQTTLNTVAGTQTISFTPSGDSWTPKLVIIAFSGGTALDSLAVSARNTIGAYDGTNQWTINNILSDGSNTARGYASDARIGVIRHPSTDTLRLDVVATGFVENGVTLNIVTPFVAHYVNVLFLGGSEFQAHVAAPDLTSSTVETVTPGFETRGLLVFTPDVGRLISANGFWNDGFYLNVGMASFDGASTYSQCSYQHARLVNSTGAPSSRNSEAAVWITPTGETMVFENVTATTYDLDYGVTTENGSAGLIAMNAGSRRFFAGVVDAPTAAGSKTFTEVGFTAKALVALTTMRDDINAIADGTAESGSFGLGFVDQDGNEGNFTHSDEDGANPTNNAREMETTALSLNDDAQAAAFEATFTEFAASGPTFNFTDADATARKFHLFAVEA